MTLDMPLFPSTTVVKCTMPQAERVQWVMLLTGMTWAKSSGWPLWATKNGSKWKIKARRALVAPAPPGSLRLGIPESVEVTSQYVKTKNSCLILRSSSYKNIYMAVPAT
jgi:hypothetical protein